MKEEIMKKIQRASYMVRKIKIKDSNVIK